MCSFTFFFYNYCSINFMCFSITNLFLQRNLLNITKLITHVTMLDILIFIFCLVFSIFFFIVDDFFIHYFTQWLLGCLIRCVHKFFDLHLGWPMLA